MKIKYLTSESLSKVSDFLNKGNGFEQFIKTSIRESISIKVNF